MGKQLTNWESTETWQRLVSSMLATGYKPDLRATATYFGTTYDTLENRFRKLKKEAEVLKSEVDRGDRVEIITPSRTKSTPSTPRKPKTPKKDPLECKSIVAYRVIDRSLLIAFSCCQRKSHEEDSKQEDNYQAGTDR